MLGIDLCQELASAYEVDGFDIVNSQQSTVHRFYKGDITDRDEVVNTVKAVRPEVVIHTAAWADVDGCEGDKEKARKVNTEGSRNIALACKDAGAVLIYMSTDFVFDGKKKSPYIESDTTHPLGTYAWSKREGEKAIQETIDRYFILRTGWLYGRCGKNFVDTIIGKARTEKVLRVVNDQIGSPTYTKDLAKAIRALLDKISSGLGSRVTGHENDTVGFEIYHVSNSGSVSWYEYAKEILRLVGSKTEVVPISSEELARPARRPAMSVLNTGKFEKYTSCKMRPWRDALKEYIKEERK